MLTLYPIAAGQVWLSRLSLIVLIGLLVGCQSLRKAPEEEAPPATEADIAERESRLQAFKPWRAFGSLVIDSESEGIYNVSFTWDVAADGFQIKLFGPLGLQQYQVSEDVNGAELIADGDRLTGYSAEYLLRQALGVDIPLRHMQSWAVGLPLEAQQVERDRRGRLSKLVHEASFGATEAWEIEYQRYSRFEDLDLPRTIVVAGDGVEIRLSVKRWLKPETTDNGRLAIPGISS